MSINPNPPLDETISPGQTGHIADHEAIAESLNVVMDATVVRRTTAQSIPNNTSRAVSFEAAVYQNGGPMWVIGAPTRLTVVDEGEYMFGGTVRWASNATGNRALWLLVSGAYVSGLDDRMAVSAGLNPAASVSSLQKLTAGSYVELRVLQSSGGALDIDDGGFDDSIWAWMKRVG